MEIEANTVDGRIKVQTIVRYAHGSKACAVGHCAASRSVPNPSTLRPYNLTEATP